MSPITVRQMLVGDISFAQWVRGTARWNQTASDWQRLLRLNPQGCFIAELNRQRVGTVTTTVYDRMAWIGMMLVHPDFRRRGVATTLLRHCLDWLLGDLHIPCVKLDATPAGQSVYQKLGFEVEFELERWSGWTIDQQSTFRKGLEKDERFFLDSSLDQQAFSADRKLVLDALWCESVRCFSSENAFGMLRSGEGKLYLGPVVANQADQGELMISRLLQMEQRKPVYWDIPVVNCSAIDLATRLGFVRERKLIRMWKGTEFYPGNPQLQWAISGPETG